MNPASHQLSCLASATLAKCAFLCTVLAENLEHFHLAFCVGMFGLEMARPPASTKPLEVSTGNSEQVKKIGRTLKEKVVAYCCRTVPECVEKTSKSLVRIA